MGPASFNLSRKLSRDQRAFGVSCPPGSRQRTFSALNLEGANLEIMNLLMETQSTTELESRLSERVPGRVQHLRILRMDGRLVVEGIVRSFHVKQLISHAAMELAPDEEWVNAITVEQPAGGRLSI
jgi:hypothetical protein